MSVVDKTYCRHYRDGLPFCAKCEADRAERNEQMHAQIAELERELTEARAEIEHLRQELRDCSTLAARQIVPAEMLVDDLTAEIERKDALIEQMKEALLDVKMNADKAGLKPGHTNSLGRSRLCAEIPSEAAEFESCPLDAINPNPAKVPGYFFARKPA